MAGSAESSDTELMMASVYHTGAQVPVRLSVTDRGSKSKIQESASSFRARHPSIYSSKIYNIKTHSLICYMSLEKFKKLPYYGNGKRKET